MKLSIKKIIPFILSVLIFSCSDNKNPLTDFKSPSERGSFIRFTDTPLTTVNFDTPSTATIEDVNNNTKNFKLVMEAKVASLSNKPVTVDFEEFSKFPVELSISPTKIAEKLNIPVSDLSFGDTFSFSGTAERNDGTIFNAEIPKVKAPDKDKKETQPIYNGGNISVNLLNGKGYSSAMKFSTTLTCPKFDLSELVGTYQVVKNGLSSSEPKTNRTVKLGPGENELTISPGPVSSKGGKDLIIKVDNINGGKVSLGTPTLAFPKGAFGDFDSKFGKISTLVTPCSGEVVLDLPLTLTCCGGVYNFTLKKI